MTLAAATDSAWRWVPHPEVWVLVGGLTVLYVYAARVIGPKAVAAGTAPVSGRQWRWFGLGAVLLWLAADWPMHDIGEQYLYSVHMVQHTLLTLVIPPVLLLATPEWLACLLIGRGTVQRWFHRLTHPVVAAGIFNGLVLLTHWQAVVNLSTENGLFHYGVHAAMVTSAFLLWIPVCGPLPERRIAQPSQMLYLFLTSIIPTVPGAWLTFADGAVYSGYDIATRVWGLSVTSDQQAAGLIMKVVQGSYLWLLIAIIFFSWSSKHFGGEGPRPGRAPGGDDEVLTFDAVQAEFERHPAAPTDPSGGSVLGGRPGDQ